MRLGDRREAPVHTCEGHVCTGRCCFRASRCAGRSEDVSEETHESGRRVVVIHKQRSVDSESSVQTVRARPRAAASRWRWQATYGRRLFWTDSVVVLLAVVLAHVVRFGHENMLPIVPVNTLNYSLISVVLAVAWLAALRVFGPARVG